MSWFFIGIIVFAVVGIVGLTAYQIVEYGFIDEEELIGGIGIVVISALIWPIMLVLGALVLIGWGVGQSISYLLDR